MRKHLIAAVAVAALMSPGASFAGGGVVEGTVEIINVVTTAPTTLGANIVAPASNPLCWIGRILMTPLQVSAGAIDRGVGAMVGDGDGEVRLFASEPVASCG